jgi:YegS/Rv2252/BmrU family lipid kinase
MFWQKGCIVTGSIVKLMPKTTLIYNPLAGPADLASTIKLVADIWQARGWETRIQPTQAPGHATELARQAAVSGYDLVFAVGGDGTLGEVANGLVGTDTAMAPLPAGTGNSFAKELQMKLPRPWARHNLLETAVSLANGRIHHMDLGYTHLGDGNGRYWLLWAGTGADGFLVDQLEPRPKWSKKLGMVGYFIEGLSVAPKFPEMKAAVNIDGQVYENHFTLILISNCRLYAGGAIQLSPQAALDDGQFEVWLFCGRGVGQTLWQLLQAKRGIPHDAFMVNGRNITITTTPTFPCQTDGDRAGHTPLHCEIKPRALRLLVPDTAPIDLFNQPGQPLA